MPSTKRWWNWILFCAGGGNQTGETVNRNPNGTPATTVHDHPPVSEILEPPSNSLPEVTDGPEAAEFMPLRGRRKIHPDAPSQSPSSLELPRDWKGRLTTETVVSHDNSSSEAEPTVSVAATSSVAVVTEPASPASQLPEQADSPSIVTVLHAYTALQPDELMLVPGDRLLVMEISADGWWRGRRLHGNEDSIEEGWFPSNHAGPALPIYRVRALYAFSSNNSTEMSFERGETLDIFAEPTDDPDWLMAAANAPGIQGRRRQGLVPRNYVAPLQLHHCASTGSGTEGRPLEDQPLSDFSFYWNGISRASAGYQLMRLGQPGQFLVRVGESNPDDLTLTVRAHEKSRNFKIHRIPGRSSHQNQQNEHGADQCAATKGKGGSWYKMGQKEFPSLQALICYYTDHPIYRSDTEECFLVEPFVRPD